jgi:hypothetical protein
VNAYGNISRDDTQAGYEVTTVMLLRIQIVWNVTLVPNVSKDNSAYIFRVQVDCLLLTAKALQSSEASGTTCLMTECPITQDLNPHDIKV